MRSHDDITPEDMTVEEAEYWLGTWILHAAISSGHRTMYEEEIRLGNLCDQAGRLLSDEKYSEIYNRVKDAHT